jgi:diguanylate cyclase (GGDEF)-like protein
MRHTILIIDDSEDIHPLIKASLDSQEIDFMSVYDGSAGAAEAARVRPDLILLDVDMPGIDGFEVFRMLKASDQTRSIPIIFLTGASSAAEKLKGLAVGAADYVTKPFDPAELCARVRSALRLHDLLALLAQQNSGLQKSEERFRVLAVLEQDRAAVLESIAQNQEIEIILDRLVQMVQRQFSGAAASVAVVSDGRTLHVAPDLTLKEAVALEQCALGQLTDPRDQPHSVPGIGVADIIADAPWGRFRDACPESSLKSCWSIPVRTRMGGILALFMVCHRFPAEPDTSARKLLDLTAKLLMIALEHRHIANQLAYRAHHDGLTGLPNRILFEDRLAQALARSDRTNEPAALLYLDLDRFKFVNDTLGHQAGDELLCQVVKRMLQHLRKTDTLARLGGDEFALLLPEMNMPDGAEVVAAKMISALQAPFDIAGREVFVTVSIGVAVHPRDATDALTLQKSADAAMYRAKAAGKNQAQTYLPDMAVPNPERLDLANSFRRALDNDELELHYQPLVDCDTQIVGFEALLRWNHPKLGQLPPAEFIATAEETGLIIPIGKWVLREAIRCNRQWQLEMLPPVAMSVNVSAIQFGQADFVQTVRAALEESQLDPHWLELEITETILMQNFSDAADKLAELRSLGVRVAIDDFGTGYSSLAYVQRLPVDTLKIDRTFVRGIPIGEGGSSEVNETAVIRAVTLLAHNLGMRTVAEGVENELQRAVLIGIGCDIFQGYLFSRPCAEDQARSLLISGILPHAACLSLSA